MKGTALAGVCLVGVAIWAGAATVSVSVQNARPADGLRTQSMDVSDNLYLVSGGGGNALMMTGDTGVLLVDTKLAGHGRGLIDIAASISDQPITTAIYTHPHVDHTGGSLELPTLRQIVAHEKTKAIMEKMGAYTGAGARALPTTTFLNTLTLGEGRDRVVLSYYGAGHTSGDIVVVFPGKRAAYLGDLFPGKTVPVVDAASGGSFVAWPDTLARAAAALTGITKIITAHGVPPQGSPLGRWITMADLQEYVNFTRDFLAAAQDAFKTGKTADAAVASLNLAGRYPAYNLDGARAGVEAIYAELRANR